MGSIRNRLALGMLLLALCSGASWAKDDSDAELAVKLPSTLGLSGFMDMIDARTPDSNFSIRTGARYEGTVRNLDFSGAVDASLKLERHDLVAYAGGSILGLVDISVRIPYTYRRIEINRKGLQDQTAEYDNGWGSVDLAAKVSLKIPNLPILVAPYVAGRLPTSEGGKGGIDDLAEVEYGGAVTLTLFNQYLGVHANIAGIQIEEGVSALRIRAGASFVALATKAILLRPYVYGDYIEFEGRSDSNVDIEFGVQSILFRLVTVEVGVTVRVLDANFLGETIEDAVESPQGGGIVDRHVEDDGTWGVRVGVGVVF